jgi:acetyl-CoA C-acetyltransferase
MLYDEVGITNPREQIDVAELYVPFSWYEPMWLEGHDIAARARAGSWSTRARPSSRGASR